MQRGTHSKAERTHASVSVSVLISATLFVVIPACGARTGLEAPHTDASAPEPPTFAPSCAEPPACDPARSGPEVCNGRDDDCDGGIDEGLALEVLGGPWTVAREADGPPCDGCGAPADVGLVCSGDALHVVWRASFERVTGAANTFSLPLTADGPSSRPAASLGPWSIAHLGTAVNAAPLLTLCERIGDNGHPSWALFGSDVAAVPLGGETDRCLSSAAAIATEGGFFVARLRAGTSVVLDRLARDGTATGTDLVLDGGFSSPGFAFAQHDGVTALVVGAENRSDTPLFRFDANAMSVGGFARVPDPGLGWRQPALVRTGAGWLVLGASADLYSSLVGDDGLARRPPTQLGTNTVREFAAVARGPNDVLVIVSDRTRSPGFTTHALGLDAEGNVAARVPLGRLADSAWRFPRLYSVGGVVYAGYVTATAAGEEARVATLRCAP